MSILDESERLLKKETLSPRPWHVDEGDDAADVLSSVDLVVAEPYGGTTDECRDNSILIAHAVNTHPVLVEAARWLIRIHAGTHPDCKPDCKVAQFLRDNDLLTRNDAVSRLAEVEKRESR